MQAADDPANAELTKAGNRAKFNGIFNTLAVLAVPQEKEQQDLLKLTGRYAQLALTEVQDSRFKISRVFKAGSAGRATNVTGSFDLDIIAFVKGDLTPQLREHALDQAWAVFSKHGAVERGAGKPLKPSPYVLAFKDAASELEIDFLVAQDAVRNPSCKDRPSEQARALMAPVHERPAEARPDKARCIALGESLTERIKGLHANVNAVVRLAKLWVKRGLVQQGLLGADAPEREVHIKVPGILIEVLVMFACQQLVAGGRGGKPSTRTKQPKDIEQLDLFIETLRVLQEVCESRVQVILRDADYTPQQAQAVRHCWGDTGRVVLHPVDPTWNIAHHVCIRDVQGPERNTKGMLPETWTLLGRQARKLRKALKTEAWSAIWSQSTLGTALKALEES